MTTTALTICNNKSEINKENKLPIPRKLNQGMIAALSLAIANGNYAVTACQLCGIDWHTLQKWLKLGSQELINDEPDSENIYLQLVTSLKRAEAQAEDKLVQFVRDKTFEKKDPYAGMMFMERRWPERWGRRDRTRVDINERKSITITHVEVVLNQGDGKQIIEGESRELKEGE